MNPDGTEIRRISYPKDSVEFSYASWSPDLAHIAVVWNYSDLRRQEFPGLALTDSSGSLLYSLIAYCNDSAPVWSPNGTWIAFSKPATTFGGILDVYLVRTSGTNLKKTTHFTNTATKYNSTTVRDWVDDNTLLVTIQTDSVFQDSSGRWNYLEDYRICEMDIEGTIVRENLGGPLIYYAARISPDHTQIAYLYNDVHGLSGVAIASRDGANDLKVAPEFNYLRDEGWYSSLCWSPDGSLLCFSADRPQGQASAAGEIYVVARDGGGFKTLISDTIAYVRVTDWR